MSKALSFVCLVALAVHLSRAGDEALGHGPSRKILQKPGKACKSHPDYPKTMQCAKTGNCIAFPAQWKNGKCDCCGPDKDCETCDDHSDENRNYPPGDCSSHPHYSLNLTFQCAETKKCISLIPDWNNGRCDCCPEANGDCSKCNDHSDEECRPGDWSNKFYCDGKCLDISSWEDGKIDCPWDCIEPDVKEQCLKNQAMKKATDMTWFCQKLEEKQTAYYNCTSETKCLTIETLFNGRNDCAGGEDEEAGSKRIKTKPEWLATRLKELNKADGNSGKHENKGNEKKN